MADVDIDARFACNQCGTVEDQRQGRGRPFTRCERCRNTVAARTMAQVIASAVCNQDHACEGCGVSFKPRGADRTRFCSRKCAFNWMSRMAALKAYAARALAKEIKGLRLIRTGQPRRLKRIDAIRAQRARAARPCKVCGAPVGRSRTKTFPATTCSALCASRTEAAREWKKTARKAGKARKRVATVESVSALKVFERDGWLCHLCGRKTDRARRGTYHPKAPELDHIVPLAKGGAHSYANTACAHRKCNAAKSDTIMGQPSLLAA